MKIIQKITVKDLEEPMRLNTFCETYVSFFESRKSVKKTIKSGNVWLNGQASEGGTWLKNGDDIWIIDPENKRPKTYELKISIIYEDDDLAVVYKPAGLIVSGNQFKTLANALIFNLKPSPLTNALPWPLPVHRLDSQTSGLVIVAKTKTARIALGQMFEEHAIQKTYHAIVMGRLSSVSKARGVFDGQVDQKKALTRFEVLSETRSLKNDWLTYIKLMPKTGRTHQLRIHLSNEGTPILGDRLYSQATIKHKGLFLAATGLNFQHPIHHQNLSISIQIPPKFETRLRSEARRWQKINGSNTDSP